MYFFTEGKYYYNLKESIIFENFIMIYLFTNTSGWMVAEPFVFPHCLVSVPGTSWYSYILA